MSKQHLIAMLAALREYVLSGIDDYLRDNSMDDYLANDGIDDFLNLAAIDRITAFVTDDDYPWFKAFGNTNYTANNDLIQTLTDDIFHADGGVDDFDTLDDHALETIIRRELVNLYADRILSCAKAQQN